ncbi:Glycosyltransferase, GT2 family [Anaerovirgula multivorans]|uniref:Glycosyltransferase, GT2 family n=1 Tax=Anaerovirgula multivorans TaxID=312168 RepID=A0A239BCF3_9FIRM|nr:glycosyltransferase [Anaerovirgula multivorans]SNS05657.1 Glycosyltransferase, GT2 family [Anaerovirgula multivorans]
MNKKRVLVGSPVYQKPEILKVFLKSLKKLNRHTISIDYMFVDDNIDENSSQLLTEFERDESKVMILCGEEQGVYLCNDESHHWDDGLMLKVANYKNSIINYAIENNYDYLFFVDSDLVLQPNLIEHLKTANKDIISEIFWSQWHNDRPFEPNVWLFDEYDLVPKKLGEKLSQKEMDIRQIKFLNQLRIPGLYEVGGLGACTLISRAALVEGVSFDPIKNLTIHGEDRFFCIRAAVLGIDLFVDTHYPAYHIYREKDLAGVQNYVKDYEADLAFVRQYKKQGNKITLSMIVKNEEGRYLNQMLNSLKMHIDEAVIIDDGSCDNTVNMCREILKDIPLHVIQNEQSMFASEVGLRKKQWSETIKTNPDWILNLDADEILEDSFWDKAQKLINNQNYDFYCFKLYDMWSETHYREDEYWNAHSIYRPFLMRYQPDFNYIWHETPQHCGRFPINTFSFPRATSEFRVKHFGWATQEDRVEKYKRYGLLDPDAIYGIREQYDSIMDTNPNLIRWDVDEVI